MTYNEAAFADDLDIVLAELVEMLIAKNAAYGDSALNPVRIFSKASPDEQLLVRIDDKLSRLARGDAAGEDVIHDLLGYLVLYRIAQRRSTGAPVVDAEFEDAPVAAPYIGPYVFKRVALVLDEIEGEITVDDGERIKVALDNGQTVEYSYEGFKLGLKQKWLAWEEEKQDGEQEKAE